MKRWAASLVLATMVLAAVSWERARAEQAIHSVVELFTSQGCSSCPPADALLGELAGEPGVVALTLPVDYWDYLGWKDTLASASYTARQRGYAEQRGDRQVYTPQMVIDGLRHAIGSDRKAVEAALAAEKQAGAMSVPLTLSSDGATVHVSVAAAPQGINDVVQAGAAAADDEAEKGPPKGVLWLMPVKRRERVKIGRGENTGRQVIYTNVVRGIMKVGKWYGREATFMLPQDIARPDGCDGYVLILQRGTGKVPGPILGAAKSPGL
ncbi:Uncharacterized protein Ga0061061_106159 [Chelatococcus sambhunathii]|uniref:DUF1223 domain-containing protein n=2 Tax=Chelatococcus TaxID=28209 RepID=A0AAC9JV18_9HYPH|nr:MULTISPECIES: DUF1223 domain-containing protein [Chelatococcus]APF38844.1 DUF1223 domain-containing protein [Chelatococcus daeguensis]CUA89063.1 Uncharacterized protein Ga0061061_106159 [Chelatococcus sambhunathii]